MSTRSVLTAFALTCAAVGNALAEDVAFSDDGQTLTIRASAYVSQWSAVDGHWLRLAGSAPDASDLLTESGPLWRVRFADGTDLDSATFLAGSADARFSHDWQEGEETLTLRYASDGLALVVVIDSSSDELSVTATMERTAKAILRVDVPSRLVFPAEPVRRVVFPQRAGQSAGIAFSRTFFLPHTGDNAGAFTKGAAGPKGYIALFGGPLHQIEDDPAPCDLRVTDAGRGWFSKSQIHLIEGHRMAINRAPAKDQATMVLVDSDNGPALCGQNFGGDGMLLRFTGKGSVTTVERDVRSQTAMISGACNGAARARSAYFRDKIVAVVALRNGPFFGGWTPSGVEEWIEQFRAAPFVRAVGARFEVIETCTALRKAMQDDEYALILNPYGEWFPTGDMSRYDADIEALRRFVQRGGIWCEVGGHPFFYVLEPRPFLTYTEQYPSASADFVHLESAAGDVAFFGVQPVLQTPWDTSRLTVPVELETGGESRGGFYRHGWHVAIEPEDGRWTSPPLVIRPGHDVRTALSTYSDRIGLRKTLADKVAPEMLPKLCSAVLIRLAGGTFEEQMKGLELLPRNNIVHFAEYLHGGFDKQYPDHVPPRVSWGTPAEFSAFYARGRELGHLMMPYTNTSWWCIGPKGPTFEREGEAPLARRRDGSIYKERYGPGNEGYKVCFWHPVVQAAHRMVRHQMTGHYPSDILFQDQVGARGWYWDHNDVAPSPTAALDGMHSLSMEDAASVPLATEDGYDRVVEFQTMLCGMAWAVVPSGGRHERRRNLHNFPIGDWENFPLMQFLAHDRAIFVLHDLGHFVTDTERLAYVVGLGYGLSYVCDATGLRTPEKRRWLTWLDTLQKRVCCRYEGQPLVDFRYPFRKPDGSGSRDVMLASYPGIRVAANTAQTPVRFADIADQDKESMAPPESLPDLDGPGFYVYADGLRAGALRSQQGTSFAFAATYEHAGLDAVVRAPARSTVTLPLCGLRKPARATVRELYGTIDEAESEPTTCRVSTPGDDTVQIELPLSLAGVRPVRVPAELRDRAPTAWPSRPKRIAVVALDGAPPVTWVEVSAADWLDSLQADTVLARNGFDVVALRTVADLAAALREEQAKRPFAILNPGGEYFYAVQTDAWKGMLDAIGDYVRTGGIWWETGGYSFHSCAVPVEENGRIVRWETVRTGPAGAARLGFACASFDVEEPARGLITTSTGRDWFGPERCARIEVLSSGIQRGFTGGKEDTVLVCGGDSDFAAAIRCGGWGWLWRLGGFKPDPDAAREVVLGVLEHLATHPWADPRVPADPRLWRVQIDE